MASEVTKQHVTVVFDNKGYSVKKQHLTIALGNTGKLVPKQFVTVVLSPPTGSDKVTVASSYTALGPSHSTVTKGEAYTLYASLDISDKLTSSQLYTVYDIKVKDASYYGQAYSVLADPYIRIMKEHTVVTVTLDPGAYSIKNYGTAVARLNDAAYTNKMHMTIVLDPGVRYFSKVYDAARYTLAEYIDPVTLLKTFAYKAEGYALFKRRTASLVHVAAAYRVYYVPPASRVPLASAYTVLQESPDRSKIYHCQRYVVMRHEGSSHVFNSASYLPMVVEPPTKVTTASAYYAIVPSGFDKVHVGTMYAAMKENVPYTDGMYDGQAYWIHHQIGSKVVSGAIYDIMEDLPPLYSRVTGGASYMIMATPPEVPGSTTKTRSF